MKKPPSQLIDTESGKIEVAPIWQYSDSEETVIDSQVSKLMLVCHPHPLYAGTMDNKIVTTLARFARDAGWHAVRFNFRGVGQSSGEYDYGHGEVADTLAVLKWAVEQCRASELLLAGFSFGGYVAMQAAQNLQHSSSVTSLIDLCRLILVAPAVTSFDVSDIRLPTDKTILYYGEDDEVISPKALADFANQHQLNTTVFSDCTHFFHGQLTTLKSQLAEDLDTL